MKNGALLVLGIAGMMATADVAAAQSRPAGAPRGFKAIPGVTVGRDWRFLKEEPARQVFIQKLPAKGGAKPSAYVRYEERANQGTPEEPMWSARNLFEFDCAGGMFRSMASDYYAGRNMTKAYPSVARAPRSWVKPSPDSIAAAAFAQVCGKR